MEVTRKEIYSWLALPILEMFVLLRTKPSIQCNEILHGIMNTFLETVASTLIKETKELKRGDQLSQLGLVCKWNKSQHEQVYQCVLLLTTQAYA